MESEGCGPELWIARACVLAKIAHIHRSAAFRGPLSRGVLASSEHGDRQPLCILDSGWSYRADPSSRSLAPRPLRIHVQCPASIKHGSSSPGDSSPSFDQVAGGGGEGTGKAGDGDVHPWAEKRRMGSFRGGDRGKEGFASG